MKIDFILMTPWFQDWMLIPIGLVVCVLAFLINYSFVRARKRREEISKHQYDYTPPETLSFEEKMKLVKMNPDKHILYGQNEFARDSVKKCIFARSTQMPDGILVHYKDILSFELIRDGKTIAGTHTGSTRNNTAQKDSATSNEDDPASKTVCSELLLNIAINNRQDPVIIMPFIFYPVKEADYRYALNAAQEIAQILDDILLLNTTARVMGQNTSLDN